MTGKLIPESIISYNASRGSFYLTDDLALASLDSYKAKGRPKWLWATIIIPPLFALLFCLFKPESQEAARQRLADRSITLINQHVEKIKKPKQSEIQNLTENYHLFVKTYERETSLKESVSRIRDFLKQYGAVQQQDAQERETRSAPAALTQRIPFPGEEATHRRLSAPNTADPQTGVVNAISTRSTHQVPDEKQAIIKKRIELEGKYGLTPKMRAQQYPATAWNVAVLKENGTFGTPRFVPLRWDSKTHEVVEKLHVGSRLAGARAGLKKTSR